MAAVAPWESGDQASVAAVTSTTAPSASAMPSRSRLSPIQTSAGRQTAAAVAWLSAIARPSPRSPQAETGR